MINPRIAPTDIPFTPSFVNIPVYLKVYGENEDTMGVSQIEVLLNALFAYREKALTFVDGDDKELTLGLIDELQDIVLDVIYKRLSASAEILHNAKKPLP